MFFRPCLKKALDAIKKPRLVLNETIVPAKCPPARNSTYRAGYDWLYWYERRLARFLEPWLKTFRHELIGEKGILCEAMSNAFCHAHKKEPSLGIRVRVFLGEKGLLIQIKDRGCGFDVEKSIEQYIRGKTYYHIAGNGMKSMFESENFSIFYDESGTRFHLLRIFDFDAGPGHPLHHYRYGADDVLPPTPSTSDDAAQASRKAETGFISMPFDKANPRVRAAMLIDRHEMKIRSFGLASDRGQALFAHCRILFGDAQSICSRTDAGQTENVWIQSPSATILISRISGRSRMLLMVLDENATLAQAKFYRPHIVKHLSRSP